MIKNGLLGTATTLLRAGRRQRPVWSLRHNDRGAVTLLVTIVLGGGVLMGMASLVVDAGQIYAEREQLQGGADAAALALAKTCVSDPTNCAFQSTKAGAYANNNAGDGAATVTDICGSGGGLSACPAEVGGLSSCVGSTPSGPYVEVRTATKMPDGSNLLPPSFAQAMVGSTYTGKEVHACARVSWGAPQSATGAAVTVSTCEWNQLTSTGTSLAPPPPAVPDKHAEGVIRLHDSKNAGTCPAGPSGWDAPGGFGWLDETAGACLATVSVNGTYSGNPGVSASGTCQTVLTQDRANQTLLLMPVFDGVKNNGSNVSYHLNGFSAFVVTGYWLSGFNAPSTLTGKNLCNGSERCLYGYFTTALLPSSGVLGSGGTSYGTSTISLSG